ncbi:MAG: 16S rRNA (guanine(966)-N(2))-methyltransferase RsmD [Streptosporangiales bacterium]
MSRIVAGIAGGRRIAAPRGFSGRPTSERAREGMFATLGSLLGDLAGLRFADLYAGTGAVGLEALSRGAAHALFVESDRSAARAIDAGARSLRLPGAAVLASPVERLAAMPPPDGEPYDVVFLDPPYALADASLARVLADLRAGGWFAPEAVAVVERSSRDQPFPWPEGFAAERERRYGDATLWYGQAH